MLKKFASLVFHYRYLIIVATLGLTAAAVPGIFRIQEKEGSTPESNFTKPNEIVRAIFDIKKTFGANTRLSAISIVAKGDHTVLDREGLKLIQDLSRDFKELRSVRKESVLSVANMVDIVANKNGDLETIPLIAKVPENEKEEKEIRDRIVKNDLIYGRLVSKDLKTAIIVAPVSEGAHNGLIAIHQHLAKMLTKYQQGSVASNFEVEAAGTPEVDYQLDSQIKTETTLFMGLALLLLIIAFYTIFRTWKGVVIPFLTTGIAIVWTMGLMGYYGQPIDILSALLPVLLVVVGSGYAIHMFHQLNLHAKNPAQFEKAYIGIVERLASPLFMTAMTTFIGNISLLAFKIEMIQHFGLFCAIGTAITFVMALVVIPAFYFGTQRQIEEQIDRLDHALKTSVDIVKSGVDLAREVSHQAIAVIPVAGPVAEQVGGAIQDTISEGVETVNHGIQNTWKNLLAKIRSAGPIDHIMSLIAWFVNKAPWLVLLIGLAVSGIAARESMKVIISFDNLSMLPKGVTIKNVTEHLNKAFNGIQSFDLVIDAKKPEGALDPAFLKKVAEFQSHVVKNPHISFAFSLVDVVKKMDGVLKADPKHPGRVGEIPNSADTISQYLLLLGMGGSSGSISVDGLITSQHNKIKMTLTTNVNDTRSFEALYEELRDTGYRMLGKDVNLEFGGNPMVWIALMKAILWGKVQNALISLLMILLTIGLLQRSIVHGLFTIMTLPIGVILNFGFMGYMGIRLDIVTAIITSFAMGIGVDFSVHFVASVKEGYKKHRNIEKAIQSAITGPGKAIMYNAITTKVGFSALLFSKFVPLKTFAILMCFTMGILAICALTILPAAIRLAPPEFITGHRESNQLRESPMHAAAKWAFSGAICILLVIGIILVETKANAAVPGTNAKIEQSASVSR